MQNIILVERDYTILSEIHRWKAVTGKHIRHLAGFSGQRACDRRLSKLITFGFISREKIIYGFPFLYQLTPKGKTLIGMSRKKEKIRIEQIIHDSTVVEVAIYIHNKYGIPYKDMTTEKELHSKDGFSIRKHRPDFIFTQDKYVICVEVELTMKSKERFEKNIKDNFMSYDRQLWILSDLKTRMYQFLSSIKDIYPNIVILDIKEIKAYMKNISS